MGAGFDWVRLSWAAAPGAWCSVAAVGLTTMWKLGRAESTLLAPWGLAHFVHCQSSLFLVFSLPPDLPLTYFSLCVVDKCSGNTFAFRILWRDRKLFRCPPKLSHDFRIGHCSALSLLLTKVLGTFLTGALSPKSNFHNTHLLSVNLPRVGWL
jgi:hypothetical protein